MATTARLARKWVCAQRFVQKRRQLLLSLASRANSACLHLQTDVKPDNILVNLCPDDAEMRFKDVHLADFGSTVSIDSEYAVNGFPLGTPIFRSPETKLILPFGPPADVWSFGTTVRLPPPSPFQPQT
jgi:serine/threonine protein kinase